MLIRDISLTHWITSGLELLININQAEYLTDGNQGAGAVLTKQFSFTIYHGLNVDKRYFI